MVMSLSFASATLPDGWSDRTVEVSHPINTNGCAGLCLEAHDLAASKLVAYREKDRIFVATLLAEHLIDGNTLLRRIVLLPVEDVIREKLYSWVRLTIAEIEGQ